jgi:hypothetical protein
MESFGVFETLCFAHSRRAFSQPFNLADIIEDVPLEGPMDIFQTNDTAVKASMWEVEKREAAISI